MIYRLRRKLIRICGISIFLVFSLIFLLIVLFSSAQLNGAMDMLTERIADNGGRFPDSRGGRLPPDNRRFPDFITAETRFSTRFFTVDLDRDGNILGENIDSVSSVTSDEAHTYAKTVFDRGRALGWISDYRYRLCEDGSGYTAVFVDGSMNRSLSRMQLLVCGAVLLTSALIIFLLIVIFSKRVVRPVAESYEKQKQFITDANHELKTPLTLILTNLDIAEAELGSNEWLEDIRIEGERMSALVNRLVDLSRMDEEQPTPDFHPFDLSAATADAAEEFRPLAEEQNKRLTCWIETGIGCIGDEPSIRRLLAILLDNAVKYCDPDGDILVILHHGRRSELRIENSFRAVGETPLNRLFDRFYRADRARSYTGGFGIGLSTAKAIVGNHHGEISAYQKDAGHIGFRVIFK